MKLGQFQLETDTSNLGALNPQGLPLLESLAALEADGDTPRFAR